MHSIECALAAPFAQHAWSPANALDAASIAAATKAGTDDFDHGDL